MSYQPQTSQLRCGVEMVSINDPPPDLHWENKTLYHKVWIKFGYKPTIAETPIRVVFIGGKNLVASRHITNGLDRKTYLSKRSCKLYYRYGVRLASEYLLLNFFGLIILHSSYDPQASLKWQHPNNASARDQEYSKHPNPSITP